jgi:hypothetical protein
MTLEEIRRIFEAEDKLKREVAHLADLERILCLQDENLELAEADGNLVVYDDWHEAVRAVAAASAEFDSAESADPNAGKKRT